MNAFEDLSSEMILRKQTKLLVAHYSPEDLVVAFHALDTHRKPVTFDDLLKAALRWRPDRIILGEVRGIEARTLLDSFNTGHPGSLATIFTELVGIQMLLLATNEQHLRGDKMALDQLNVLFRQVQATKAAKAQELLARRSQKIANQRKIILEGSQEWDILYRKYYNDEVRKLGI
jgi:type IV secretory pathway ATPase VirB11/archaellum biosynthesis ATPase